MARNGTNFRFPGQYQDADSFPFVQNHYREYMPRLGRYNRVDPILKYLEYFSLKNNNVKRFFQIMYYNIINTYRLNINYLYANNSAINKFDFLALRVWGEKCVDICMDKICDNDFVRCYGQCDRKVCPKDDHKKCRQDCDEDWLACFLKCKVMCYSWGIDEG